MRRLLCWTERVDDAVKREIRVSFEGKGIRWQWKRSDEEKWVYDPVPTAADWDSLQVLALNWYTRHRLPHDHLDRITRLRKEAGA
jgi:hypothetical protein